MITNLTIQLDKFSELKSEIMNNNQFKNYETTISKSEKVTVNDKGVNLSVNQYKAFCKLNLRTYAKWHCFNIDKEARYTREDLKQIVESSSNLLSDEGLNRFTGVEVGFEIPIKNASRVIRENILFHKTNSHSVKKYKTTSTTCFKVFEYHEYDVKVSSIDKNPDLLYVGVHFKKTRAFSNSTAFMDTLLTQEFQHSLFNLFLTKVQDLIIVDNCEVENRKLNQYIIPSYWERIKRETKKANVSKHKKSFINLIKELNLDTIKNRIIVELVNAFSEFNNHEGLNKVA